MAWASDISRVRFVLLLLTIPMLASAASEQTRPPIELRLQEMLERQDRQAQSLLLEAQEAFILLSAPVRDGPPLSELAESMFAVLPRNVKRLWLSWPGARGSEARLLWRGEPVRAQADALLEQGMPGDVSIGVKH